MRRKKRKNLQVGPNGDLLSSFSAATAWPARSSAQVPKPIMWLWLASWADCCGPRPALSGSEQLSQSKIGCNHPRFFITFTHFPCVFLMFFLLSMLFYSLSSPYSTIILSLVCFCILIVLFASSSESLISLI
jgi:hypothetical protein